MTTVNSVKELKEAIKAKKSPIVPGNKKMKVILGGVAAVFSMTGGASIPAAGAIAAQMLGMGAVAAISEPALIVIVLAALSSIIAIVAICKGQHVRVRWDSKKMMFYLETY